MKPLRFFVPLFLVLAVLLLITPLSALAQGPTPTPTAPTPAPSPTPTGKTYLDPLDLPCDWVGIDPATPQKYSTTYYKVPYARGTYLKVYAFATSTKAFGFDVYDAYNMSLFTKIEDERYGGWDNWDADKAGSGTKSKFEPSDLSWEGKANDGTADSVFLVLVRNFDTNPVWYKLCSESRPGGF